MYSNKFDIVKTWFEVVGGKWVMYALVTNDKGKMTYVKQRFSNGSFGWEEVFDRSEDM